MSAAVEPDPHARRDGGGAGAAPLIQSLGALPQPSEGVQLLCDRALERGKGALLIGDPGLETTALVVQAALLWALGLPMFGIRPAQALSTLIIQREHSDEELADVRDGVLLNLRLTAEETRDAFEHVHVVTEHRSTGGEFCSVLDDLLGQHPADLVIVDRANARVGGNPNTALDATAFLRGGIDPVIRQHYCGLLAVFHSRTPRRAKQRGDVIRDMEEVDWIDWAKLVLELRGRSFKKFFDLVGAKHGEKLGWTKADGFTPRLVTRLAVQRAGDRMYWTEVTPGLAAFAAPEMPPEASAADMVSLLSASETIPKREFHLRLRREFGFGVNRAKAETEALIAAGKLEVVSVPRTRTRPRLDVRRALAPLGKTPSQDLSGVGATAPSAPTEMIINWGDRTDVIRNGEIVRDQRADQAGQTTGKNP